jgi:hypothetical protein
VREFTMMRLIREAAEHGEAVLYIQAPRRADLSASKRLRPERPELVRNHLISKGLVDPEA